MKSRGGASGPPYTWKKFQCLKLIFKAIWKKVENDPPLKWNFPSLNDEAIILISSFIPSFYSRLDKLPTCKTQSTTTTNTRSLKGNQHKWWYVYLEAKCTSSHAITFWKQPYCWLHCDLLHLFKELGVDVHSCTVTWIGN